MTSDETPTDELVRQILALLPTHGWHELTGHAFADPESVESYITGVAGRVLILSRYETGEPFCLVTVAPVGGTDAVRKMPASPEQLAELWPKVVQHRVREREEGA